MWSNKVVNKLAHPLVDMAHMVVRAELAFVSKHAFAPLAINQDAGNKSMNRVSVVLLAPARLPVNVVITHFAHGFLKWKTSAINIQTRDSPA